LYASLCALPYHARTVRARLPGFPKRFPVRSDGRRPWRYRIVSLICRVVLRTWFGRDLVIDGIERVPREGPLLVVSNHLSNIDPMLFGGFGPGAMFCMSKQELFKNRFVAWVLAGCNCFPVDRGSADRWALRTSLDILAARGRLLIFLEGTRASAPGMKQAEAGIGFLARRSGAGVLPVAVWGTEQALPRGRKLPRRIPIRMVFGSPFEVDLPSGRGDDRAVADQIARQIAALLPSEYRGVYL
jgi:1-acyl-sn-glycerol-3-phosphate acyltransferase